MTTAITKPFREKVLKFRSPWRNNPDRERTTACPLHVVWWDDSSRRGSPRCSWTEKPCHTTDTGTDQVQGLCELWAFPSWMSKSCHTADLTCAAVSTLLAFYMAGKRKTLQIQVKNKHEGLQFPCDHCDYKAIQRESLKIPFPMASGVQPVTCAAVSTLLAF